MKKRKSLFVLLAVFAALIILYILLGAWNEKKEKSKEATVKVTTVTDLNAVCSLTYTNGKTTMRFAKEDDTWYYADNREFPLSQTDIQTIVGTVSHLSATREIKDMDDWKAYGLDEPAYTINLRDADEGEVTLLIGNGAGEDYYLRKNDEKKVYTIASTLVDSLQFDLDELKGVETFPTISGDSLKRVEITKNGETETYESGKRKDKKAIATIEGGLGVFSFVECTAYSVTGAQLAVYGLDEAHRTTAAITYEDGNTQKVLTVYIGSSDTTGTYRYAQLENSDKVNTVSAEAVKNLLNESE